MAIIIQFPQRPGVAKQQQRRSGVRREIVRILVEAFQEAEQQKQSASVTGSEAVDTHTNGGSKRQRNRHNGVQGKQQKENLR